MKKYLLIIFIIGLFSQCKKLEEKDYHIIKGTIAQSCNYNPFNEDVFEIKQLDKPKNGIHYLVITDEKGYFEIPYKAIPDNDIILANWGPMIGVVFSNDPFFTKLPTNRSIDLGHIYIRPYSHVYFKITESKSGTTGDSLFITPLNVSLISPFNDTVIGPFILERYQPSEFFREKTMNSKINVARKINGVLNIEEKNLWVKPCNQNNPDTVLILSKM